MIREACREDLKAVLNLYLHLHETTVPEDSAHLNKTWQTIMNDENHHIIVCEVDHVLVASCVCVVIPNLTRSVRPYAIIENVVTHKDYRRKGYASLCLDYASKIAKANNCYKIMLLTSTKSDHTLNFYKQAGYNSSDKTAFIKWLL